MTGLYHGRLSNLVCTYIPPRHHTLVAIKGGILSLRSSDEHKIFQEAIESFFLSSSLDKNNCTTG